MKKYLTITFPDASNLKKYIYISGSIGLSLRTFLDQKVLAPMLFV